MNYNDPTFEKIDSCQNCGENHYQDQIVAFDNTVGCAICIKECAKCFKMIDTIEKPLIPARVTQFGDDGVDSAICQACAEEVLNNPDDFKDVKISTINMLRVGINWLKAD